MRFGERLKAYRLQKDYTLKYVADYVGVTEATVQRWESGNIKSIRHTRVEKLAEILGVDLSCLIGSDDIRTFSDSEPDRFLSASLSTHENLVITAYREQPAMQPAVDRLLGVSQDTDGTPLQIAAKGGGTDERTTAITDEEIDRMTGKKNTIFDKHHG